MEVGNITKVGTFKSFFIRVFLHRITFFVTMLFNIFMRQTLNDYFGGVTQKYELRVSFNNTKISELHNLGI